MVSRLCGGWHVLGLRRADPVLDVTLSGRTGAVTESWGGYRAQYPLARGSSTLLVGDELPLILLALTLASIAPFVDLRRLRRPLHLDLLALLAVMVSVLPFRYGDVGLSTPLAAAGLLLIVGRMIWLAREQHEPQGPTLTRVPARWLVASAFVLLAARGAYNIAFGLSDVGYYSAYGAQSLLDGFSVYQHGSSIAPVAYGPAMYLAYLPFVAIFPLPGGVLRGGNEAVHAATIAFDYLTAGGLYLLGRRLRRAGQDRSLGPILLFAWAANPLAFYATAWSTNDVVVSLFLVLALLTFTSPLTRGVFAGLATAAKWTPVVVLPALSGLNARQNRRVTLTFVAAAALTCLIIAVPFLPPGGLPEMVRVSLSGIANKQTPFSVWGLYGLPSALRQAFLIFVCLAALTSAWWPARRTPAAVAALMTAILAAMELALPHWIYTYGAWFVPSALVAIFARHVPRAPALTASEFGRSHASQRASR